MKKVLKILLIWFIVAFVFLMVVGIILGPAPSNSKRTDIKHSINTAETYGKPREIKVTKGDKGTVVVVSMATTDPIHDALILKDALEGCDVKGAMLLDINVYGEVEGTYVIK